MIDRNSKTIRFGLRVESNGRIDLKVFSTIGSGVDPTQSFPTDEVAIPLNDLDLRINCGTDSMDVFYKVTSPVSFVL